MGSDQSYSRILSAAIMVMILVGLSIGPLAAEENPNPITSGKTVCIVLVGDLTVTDHDGWGGAIGDYFNENVKMINHARGGRSSKSFINQGRLKKAIAAKPDYLFIKNYHRGWDHHNGLPQGHPKIAKEVDQGSAALVMDLKQRGLLEDTLVIWGGEFGRTVYRQGGSKTTFGRDHHPRCFSIWMAGGGVKPGISIGKTDDWCYNIVEDGVHVHDLNATILHLMGFDHERLTYRFQGRDFRLTDVHGQVIQNALA